MTSLNPPASLPTGVTRAYTNLLLSRTAAKEAAFLLPHLRPGMDLLDCGCGHGTISVGLAEAVAPGHVIGIDLDQERIAAATTYAARRGVTNVQFRVADLHELPFPDSSFDAAFEHAVFMYLKDPVRAATEVSRVLKPGGVFGARDTDWAALMLTAEGVLADSAELVHAWYRERGTDLQCGRRLRGILAAAGFHNVEGSASCDCHGTPDTLRQFADTAIRMLEQPSLADFATQSGRADAETLDRMRKEWNDWAARPDSFHASVMGEAVGWKP